MTAGTISSNSPAQRSAVLEAAGAAAAGAEAAGEDVDETVATRNGFTF
jgi:hypothetical protein